MSENGVADIEHFEMLFFFSKKHCIPLYVVPLCVATLAIGHPSYGVAILVNKFLTVVFNIQLTRGHPSNSITE